jgi:hypothetical protein
MEVLLSVALGLGLAAAAGLRVFVPIFGAGLAGHFGFVSLSPAFSWVAGWPALIAFGTATVLEIVAYHIPWLDNLLDTVATPAAVAAGMVASASVMTDLPQVLKWSVAIIGGGGFAAVTQLLSVATRAKSSLATAGLGNPVVATAETAGSVALSLFAIFLPLVCLLLLAAIGAIVWRTTKRLRGGRGRSS